MKIRDLIKFSGYKRNKDMELEIHFDDEKVDEDQIFFARKDSDDDTPQRFVLYISSEPLDGDEGLEIDDEE